MFTKIIDNLPFDIYKDSAGKIWVSKISLVRIFRQRKKVDSTKIRDQIEKVLNSNCLEYEEIVVNATLGGDIIFVSCMNAICWLMHCSEYHGFDIVSSRLNFILSFSSSPTEALTSNPTSSSQTSSELLNIIRKLFLKIDESDQLAFLTHLQKHGSPKIKSKLNGKNKRGSYSRKPTSNADTIRRQKSQLSNKIMKSIKEFALGKNHPSIRSSPMKNPQYKESAEPSTMEDIMYKYDFDKRLTDAVCDFVDDNRMLFQKI